MGRINVLGFDIANLIAAGEVVDRPSSVVKELLENSIDAGADKITVEIKNGGTTFIRITDNGVGMEHADLPVSILRHATSKIKEAEDLNEIMTLGFRGEALAAISSVSKIRIMSKQRDKEGSLLEAHGGTVLSHMQMPCPDGTTVIVEDLFYNIPARRKFLKKDITETLAITAVVEKIALSRPDIAIRYIVDGGVKYVTSGDGELNSVIYAILGRDIAKKTIKVEREENGILVEGYISTPEITRANRNFENFYINSRYVKSMTATAAIEEAYSSYIPAGKFPFCVLNIKINPSIVDVNVHPAKLEVKFSNERLVFSAVYYAVRNALSSEITRPSLYDEEKTTAIPTSKTPFPVRDKDGERVEKIVFDTNTNVGILRQNNTLDYSGYKKATEPSAPPKMSLDLSGIGETSIAPAFEQRAKEAEKNDDKKAREGLSNVITEINKGALEIPNTIEENKQIKTVPEYKIIGEAFNSYVIVEMGDLMYMIDKHAAHERIIFEDLKEKLKQAKPSSQMLMLPYEATLSKEEMGALNEWGDEVRKTGFGYEVISNTAVSLYEIPSEIDSDSCVDAFVTLLSKLAVGEADAQKSRYEAFERALYQASCKSAIKAGRVYDREHIKWICDRVLTLDNIKYCPHGRPVAFEITKHFLEKQFERI